MHYASMNGRRMVMLGFGSLGPAVLALLIRHIALDPGNITVVSAEPHNREMAEARGARFLTLRLVRTEYIKQLEGLLSAGDVLLNLSLGVSSRDLIEFCRSRGVLYLDTSSEEWCAQKRLEAKTTFLRRSALLDGIESAPNSPTALICHGANPGLVSHFTKRALLEIAEARSAFCNNAPRERADWAMLAQRLGVSSIHIVERDTQFSRSIIEEASNTWSITGLLDEMQEPSAVALGGHKLEIPDSWIGLRRQRNGCQVVELTRPAKFVTSDSWVPSVGFFTGYLVPHPEVFSIAEYLTLTKVEDGTSYQPTSQFVYKPCQTACASISTSIMCTEGSFRPSRVLLEEIDEGADELGVLLIMAERKDAFWFGSILDIQTARRLAPHNNATSLQTAAGVLGGLVWLLSNPFRGLVEPEQIDFAQVLDIARPYLGSFGGHWIAWHAQGSIALANCD